MRTSAIALVLSLLGIVAGASLIGVWAVGCAVIFDSLCVGVWALHRDDEPQKVPARPGTGGVSFAEILERSRQAP